MHLKFRTWLEDAEFNGLVQDYSSSLDIRMFGPMADWLDDRGDPYADVVREAPGIVDEMNLIAYNLGNKEPATGSLAMMRGITAKFNKAKAIEKKQYPQMAGILKRMLDAGFYNITRAVLEKTQDLLTRIRSDNYDYTRNALTGIQSRMPKYGEYNNQTADMFNTFITNLRNSGNKILRFYGTVFRKEFVDMFVAYPYQS